MTILISTLIGVFLGLLYAGFTGVDDIALINHHCAYYSSISGELIWYDTNKTVH